MRYASSDIHSFTNAQCPQGGHQRKIVNQKDVNKGAQPKYAIDDLYGDRLVIDCSFCEPLLNAKDSWSGDPLNIPLTDKEKAEALAIEKQGLRDQATAAQALAELARERVAAGK